MKKGTVSISMIASGATTLLVISGAIFSWTYAQFAGVTAHASESDQRLAKVEQATTDFDARLTRIENKIDTITTLISKK